MKCANLTPRQQRFVAAYVAEPNGAAAAVKAGFAARSARITASKLLTKANIRSAVGTARRELEAKHLVDRDRVIAELLQAVDLAREKGDPGSMISAWREIAKICGYYAPEVRKVNVNIAAKRVIEKLETLPDAELLAMVETNV